MARDLLNVSNLRKKYPEKSEEEFQSLKEYYDIAIKSIKRYADKIQYGLSKRVLLDEDAIANIVHKIMMGDWRYQEGKGTKRTSYLSECCKWALREYVRREAINHQNKKSIDPQNLNWQTDYNGSSFYIPTSEKDPLDILIEKEEEEQNYIKVDQMIANSGLNPLEEACVRIYQATEDFKVVGEELDISKGYAKTIYYKALGKVAEKHA